MHPSSTHLLPLCVAFLLGATTTTTMAASAADDAAANDILTTINLDKVLARRQSALGPHYIKAIWTTSSIESVNLGGGKQIVHNSGFSLTDEEGNNHLIQRLSSRLTTHRAKVGEPHFSIDRKMSRGRTFFNSDLRRTLVGSRNLVRWRIREGIVLASAVWGYEWGFFFNGISVGMSECCGLSFSVGRECYLYGSFGRYRGLLS